VVVGECIVRLLAGKAGGAEILPEDVAYQRPRQDRRYSFDFFEVGDVDRTPRTLEPRVHEEHIHEEPDGRHLTAHGGDAERGLAATDGLGAIRDELNPVLDATLDCIPAVADAAQHDPEATLTYSEGSPAAGSRFSILPPQAHGGLGQTSVALNSELNRKVAMKELRPEGADGPHSRARFLLEAEITGRLEHPGVAPVYGLGCNAQGRPFYAMRLVKGQSLKEVNGTFPQLDEQWPGLIPLELLMPEMGGFSFLSSSGRERAAPSRSSCSRPRISPARTGSGSAGPLARSSARDPSATNNCWPR